jgi:hypothetical protein
MLGQALRWVARPATEPVAVAAPVVRPPRVDLSRCDEVTAARLQALAAATGAFEVARDTGRAEVAVVTLGDGDGDVVARLRREHRAEPGLRTVVVGRGTTWFDAAFGAGVDVWIDHTADDGTVLAAIVGPPRRRGEEFGPRAS